MAHYFQVAAQRKIEQIEHTARTQSEHADNRFSKMASAKGELEEQLRFASQAITDLRTAVSVEKQRADTLKVRSECLSTSSEI